jgi:Concanavalin A-like lectin/glucanases superfamily
MTLHRTFASLALLLASCSPGRLNVVGRVPNSLQQGMVAYWPCDEGTGDAGIGGMLLDHSGFGYNGSIIGGTLLPDSGHAGFGGALHFDSGNSVIVGSFPNALDSWSVALWVRPGSWASSPPASGNGNDTYVTLISTEIAGNTEITGNGGWEMNIRFPGSGQDTNGWRYNFAYPNPADAGPWWYYEWAEAYGVDVSQWTHLVAVVDSSVKKILFYKNGVQSGENPITSFIRPGSNALYFGTWSGGGRYFVGDLDDIVIYGRALAAAEVALLFKQPAPSNTH